ncbi:uncharacterized protein BX663DRAFT_430009 [Cokeromyces recurvatus]|uniref:uncharacterized protein n=1 Tax=Cokeromyces recurvatus TaxID=90255 RepID=UPI00221F6265|nr:uncharacterized protein BX663DRAFT_430009 [Cokeromyces recurvatus]KAI7905350.1 hypothetical protein BX663DRAFT_430009 [Cokeromyces recurvatus]
MDLYNSSYLINPHCIKDVTVNQLGPREQEEADEPFRKGINYLFDNKLLKAKALLQTKAYSDPLYALGLGLMTFMKAIMTFNKDDKELAIDTLTLVYNISKVQTNDAIVKKPYYQSLWSTYFPTFISTTKYGLPSADPPLLIENDKVYKHQFISNGILRAYAVKAESCLLMGILYMLQEDAIGYLKCSLKLRKAFGYYSIIWQEHKRMGQEYTKYIDRDTVSGMYFGIGTIHLLLSILRHKLLKSIPNFGLKSDIQLGLALLKICVEGKGVRASLASLILLTYYCILSSLVPQLYSKELMLPAVECLKIAQKQNPNSCFFLIYAAYISRISRNLALSTQSFTFAIELSRHDWGEHAISQLSFYEIGFNFALQLDWESSMKYFEKLVISKDHSLSPVFCQYFIGSCKRMMGDNTGSILAFAKVSQLLESKEQYQPLQNISSCVDVYVQQKVKFLQRKGYQDIDICLPGLEFLLIWNAYGYMEEKALKICLDIVQNTIELIYEREKTDYNIRLHELMPSANLPNYYVQRAILLLIKASILNALKRHNDSIPYLNWIIDNMQYLKLETWTIPFTYWEAGITSWKLGDYAKSKKLWEQALTYTNYAFEYRMAVRLNLALNKFNEKKFEMFSAKRQKELSTNGKKRVQINSS